MYYWWQHHVFIGVGELEVYYALGKFLLNYNQQMVLDCCARRQKGEKFYHPF